MTDDDVEHWGDVLYLRGLTDAIEALCERRPLEASRRLRDLDAGGSGLLGLAIQYGCSATIFAEHDTAATLLDTWRAAA